MNDNSDNSLENGDTPEFLKDFLDIIENSFPPNATCKVNYNVTMDELHHVVESDIINCLGKEVRNVDLSVITIIPIFNHIKGENNYYHYEINNCTMQSKSSQAIYASVTAYRVIKDSNNIVDKEVIDITGIEESLLNYISKVIETIHRQITNCSTFITEVGMEEVEEL